MLGSKPTLKLKVAPKTTEEITTFLSFRRFFKIDKNWDAILSTDGSGKTYDKTVGWAGTLFLKSEQEPKPIGGCLTEGTNNVAELMAVFQAAMFLANNDYGVKELGFNLYVISDSTYVVNGLTKLNDSSEDGGTIWATGRNTNLPIWLGLLGCRRQGIIFHPRHIGRNQLPSSVFSHNTANTLRKLIATKFPAELPIDWND